MQMTWFLSGESEEDLKVMEGRFIEVYRKRYLKVNANKSKVMVLGDKKGLECEVNRNGRRLEQMSKLKYLRCARVLHEALLVPVLLYGSETKIWK